MAGPRAPWISSVVLSAVAIAALVATAYRPPPRIDRDDAFVIDRFVQQVTVQPDGAIDVVEDLAVRFVVPRRGIFRDLPLDGPTGRSQIEVLGVDQGRSDTLWRWQLESPQPDEVRIRIGDPDVTLAPGSYRYRIHYRLEPAAFVDPARGVAEVRLDVPGFAWPTTVAETDLTVQLPAAAWEVTCVAGRVGTVAPCPGRHELDSRQVRWRRAQALPPGHSMTVGVIFDPSALSATAPRFEAQPILSGSATAGPWRRLPAHLTAGGLLLAVIGLVEVTRYRDVYRDRVTDPVRHDAPAPPGLYAPPDGLRPAELAALFRATLTRSGGPTDQHLATMIDLQQRGHLDVDRPGLDWELARTTVPPPDGWERHWLDALVPAGQRTTFGDGYDKATSRRDAAARQVVAGLDPYVDRGLLHGPGFDRSGLLIPLMAGVLVVLVGRQLAGLEAPTLVGLLIAVACWALVRRRWREQRLPLNSAGRDLLRRARAFRRFIVEADAQRLDWAASQPDIGPLHPSVSLLPYALALGMADSWYRRFRDLIPAATGDGATWYATQSGYQSFTSTRSSAVTAPSSSGSGGSFGGGGGGGGSGGGGGGSW